MQKLIQGLHRFQKDVFRKRQQFFERLAQGQSPETLFITCSDSRITPNELTQTGPGDLFIIRNAGNIVPPFGAVQGGEEATIEYAISALGVKDIIVCGHSHCGAMKALNNPSDAEGMPSVQRWLTYAEATQRIIKENYTHLSGDSLQMATVEENVLVQLENLRTHPTVAAALSRNKIHLHGWVYKLDTGVVFEYDPENDQFGSIVEDTVGAAASTRGQSREHSNGHARVADPVSTRNTI